MTTLFKIIWLPLYGVCDYVCIDVSVCLSVFGHAVINIHPHEQTFSFLSDLKHTHT